MSYHPNPNPNPKPNCVGYSCEAGAMSDLLPTLAVLLLCALVATFSIRRFGGSERPLIWISFFAHQVAGVLSIWVTKYYYGFGDMLSYHEFGVVAADRLRADFWQLAPGLLRLLVHTNQPLPIPAETLSSSSGAMQAISAFAMYFLFDSLYATCALIAGLAFLSKLALYSVTCKELPQLPRRHCSLLACFCRPRSFGPARCSKNRSR